ncbi:MAG TPA: DNA cytosine methyltransferase [Pyrinomonadaceae bacterium]
MGSILTNTYFSGAGLMDIGLKVGGLTLQQSVEVDKICCDTIRQNFSHEVVQSDITKKVVLADKECQVMVATYPCTRYSPIGDIHGVRTGDDLFLHFFRHVAIRRPELYVVENVPGMKKFPVVMEAMTKLPDYYVHVACLPGEDVHVATTKARQAHHHRKSKKLCVAGTNGKKSNNTGRDT